MICLLNFGISSVTFTSPGEKPPEINQNNISLRRDVYVH